MRMWMIDPNCLCRKHLLGEHLETHMFLGALKQSKSVKGYLEKNLFEPKKLLRRHNELANEMIQRGYKHNSEMCEIEFLDCMNGLCDDMREIKIDVYKAHQDLFSRCPECRSRFDER